MTRFSILLFAFLAGCSGGGGGQSQLDAQGSDAASDPLELEDAAPSRIEDALCTEDQEPDQDICSRVLHPDTERDGSWDTNPSDWDTHPSDWDTHAGTRDPPSDTWVGVPEPETRVGPDTDAGAARPQLDAGWEGDAAAAEPAPDAAWDTDAVTGEDAVGPDADPIGYPLDDVLRVNHLQALGTHNSYHVEPLAGLVVPPWAYTHLPLDEQLGDQGVRKFELDLHWKDGGWKVYHVDFVDQETTCDTFDDCLQVLAGWSAEHPGHHPFLILLEIKEGFSSNQAADRLAAMDESLWAAFGAAGLSTPMDVQGVHDNVRDALAADGWPTLGETRGTALCVVHDGGDWRDVYTEGGTVTAGRPCFVDAYGDTTAPFAAYHSMNSPKGDFDAIQAVVQAGHLVRTRADSDSAEALLDDKSRFEAALDSGAHFISTDYPATLGEPAEGYWLSIPEGTPSRCNPLVAPPGCTSAAIEAPELLQSEL